MIWLEKALDKLDLTDLEESGRAIITGWQNSLGASWLSTDASWCATFVAKCLVESGFVLGAYKQNAVIGKQIPYEFYRCAEYINFYPRLNKPKVGCLAVSTNGGHIAFVHSLVDEYVYLIGGNQPTATGVGGCVSIVKKFTRSNYIYLNLGA